MKYELNGISFPFGGISWDNKTTAKDRFRYLLLYLESKRILVNPLCMEQKQQCIESVLEIKHVLVEITKNVDFNDKDTDIVRSLISACNTYLDTVPSETASQLIFHDGERWADVVFDGAMEEFRKAFALGIRRLEIRYGLSFRSQIHGAE